MDRVVREMLKIYEPISGLDWMNYKLVKTDISYHHCIKKCNGGGRIVENGALLMRDTAHPYLHLIEFKDIDTYIAINKIFQVVNEQKREPTEAQRKAIEHLLREFESVHRWDKGRKGKLLLQRKYLKRDFV